MKPSASAAKLTFQSRSGISKPPENRTGAACLKLCSALRTRAAPGIDVAADTYAYPAWFNSFSAFIPPWAHDGGDAKMIARLKDPADRARIRKEMHNGRRVMGQRMAGDSRPRGDFGQRRA